MLNKDLPLYVYLVETEQIANNQIFPVRSDIAKALREQYEKECDPKQETFNKLLDKTIDKCYNR